MILRFTSAATAGERDQVRAALASAGAAVRDGGGGALVFDDRFDSAEAVRIGSMPGVESVEPGGPRPWTRLDAMIHRTGGAAAVLAVLGAIAANTPVPLGAPADPLRTPAELRPVWPLLPWVGAVESAPGWLPMPVVVLAASLVLLLWPWIGRRLAERNPAMHAAAGAAALLLGAALAWGALR